ncbi:MAG: hypothetical protein WCX28_01440 [Bacteriovoracaceae bacterium]|nr:hypothetical protein [Bacteroidota bacterium]
MTFARNLFSFAGSYGVIVTAPMFFLEVQLNIDYPPAITHPEYFYGFIGVTLTWQFLFIMIARDIRRYRMMMIPAILEKFLYAVAGFVLFTHGRVSSMIASFAGIDLVFGALFIVAFIKTKEQSPFTP